MIPKDSHWLKTHFMKNDVFLLLHLLLVVKWIEQAQPVPADCMNWGQSDLSKYIDYITKIFSFLVSIALVSVETTLEQRRDHTWSWSCFCILNWSRNEICLNLTEAKTLFFLCGCDLRNHRVISKYTIFLQICWYHSGDWGRSWQHFGSRGKSKAQILKSDDTVLQCESDQPSSLNNWLQILANSYSNSNI